MSEEFKHIRPSGWRKPAKTVLVKGINTRAFVERVVVVCNRDLQIERILEFLKNEPERLRGFYE